MTPILNFLESHGVMLLAGTTIILLLAAILIALHKQPIHRQRLAESSMLLCILFLIFAVIPLPRFAFESKPAPAKPPPGYELQPGDEIIAAEVFKIPRPQKLPDLGLKPALSSPQPLPPVKPKLQINWPQLLAALYVAGALAAAVWLALGQILLFRLHRRSTPADSTLRESLNLPSRIRLLISDHTDRPLSFGLFHPTILLPARCLSNQNQLRHIVLHEMAHISQGDSLGHLLFNLLFPILYFHPLYWWLRRLTNLSRELIADDLAAGSSSREAYVSDLLCLARDRIARSPFSTHALGLFQSRTDFYRRMHMLVATNQPLSRGCSGIWRASCAAALIILLMLTSGTLGVRRARAQAVGSLEGATDKKNVEEKAGADEREVEVRKLREEQAVLQAQLAELAAQRKQLEAELARKRELSKKAGDVSALPIEEKLKAKREKEMADDPRVAEKAKNAAKEKAVADERGAMRDWINKKDPRAANRDPNDFNPRPQLDLVSLANSYVDAVGNLQLAQLELNQLTANLGAEHKEVIRLSPAAKIKVEIAQRKVNIFRGIAEAALQAAKMDLQQAVQLVDQGLATKSTMTEAESRLKILEVILAQ